jgi:hypothetical protein
MPFLNLRFQFIKLQRHRIRGVVRPPRLRHGTVVIEGCLRNHDKSEDECDLMLGI